MLLLSEFDLDDPPEIEALWREIDRRELDDELFLQAEEDGWVITVTTEHYDEPSSPDELAAWNAYLDSPEGKQEAAEYFRLHPMKPENTNDH